MVLFSHIYRVSTVHIYEIIEVLDYFNAYIIKVIRAYIRSFVEHFSDFQTSAIVFHPEKR